MQTDNGNYSEGYHLGKEDALCGRTFCGSDLDLKQTKIGYFDGWNWGLTIKERKKNESI